MIAREKYWAGLWLSIAAIPKEPSHPTRETAMIESKRFVVLTHRKATDHEAEFDSLEELRFMLGEVGNGHIRSIESRGDALGALIEVKAQTMEEAQAFADALPGVRAGIEKAIVIPLRE